MNTINRVSIRRGVVCRVVPSTLLLLSALFAGSGSLQAAKTPESANKDRVPEGISASDWQSIRAAHEAWQHAIEPVKGGWQARNPAQQWTTKFDGRGFEAKPQSADWTWGLELRSYGAGDEQRAVNGTPEVKAEGHRLAYHWDDTVQEWFVNDGRGLEHGFSVQERPPGPSDAPLTFLLATRGPLRAAVTDNARAVDYQDESGATILTYSGLRVWDADGRELDARFAPAEDGVTLQVDAKNARYPLLIDPIAQQTVLKGSNTEEGDGFGRSAAIYGDTLVVGAPSEDSDAKGVNGDGSNNNSPQSGAAYVFVRNAQGAWSQQAYLKANNAAAGNLFGWSVAIFGNTVVVGAPEQDGSYTDAGAAYVFVRNGQGAWSQQAYLKALNVNANDLFGTSVAVSKDTVVVGAPGEDSVGADKPNDNSAPAAGAAYVFVRDNQGTWNQQAYLKAKNVGAGDVFGDSVAISGDIVVVGAPGEDSEDYYWENKTDDDNSAPDSGAAYLFVRNGTSWSSKSPGILKATFGNPRYIDPGDLFGDFVATDGVYIVVGAPGDDNAKPGRMGFFPLDEDNAAAQSGAAYVYQLNNEHDKDGYYQYMSYLKPSKPQPGKYFGESLAISRGRIVVSELDRTYVFGRVPRDRRQNGWKEQATLKAAGRGAVAVADGTAARMPDVAVSSAGAAVFTGLGANGANPKFWSDVGEIFPPKLTQFKLVPSTRTVTVTAGKGDKSISTGYVMTSDQTVDQDVWLSVEDNAANPDDVFSYVPYSQPLARGKKKAGDKARATTGTFLISVEETAAPGKVTITATAGGQTATLTLDIKKK